MEFGLNAEIANDVPERESHPNLDRTLMRYIIVGEILHTAICHDAPCGAPGAGPFDGFQATLGRAG